MIEKNLSFGLPTPWQDKIFSVSHIGYVNFLVGPNGSGKSKFGQTLKDNLGNARLLGTDRLSGMEQSNALGKFGATTCHLALQKVTFPTSKLRGNRDWELTQSFY